MSPILALLLGLGAGCMLGLGIGWLAAWRRASLQAPDRRLEDELRQQLAQRETALGTLREQFAAEGARRAASEAGRTALEKLRDEERTLHATALQELREAQARALADLREAFKGLSSAALKETHPDFLRLANETLAKFQETAKGDLAQRQQAIATLVKPLEEQLKLYQERLQRSELSQSSTMGEVKKHLETLATQSQSLSQETFHLRRVLSSSQARGRWGEETLRRVVEAAGMSRHCDFSEQTQAGESKPDLVVRLPGDRLIIVDAKVPDLDFVDTLEAGEPLRRAESLAAHAAKLKATIKALADRDYPRQFPGALDQVVLFLPAESLFSTALEGDRELILWAAQRQVVLATPASLIGLLRAVAMSWQQHAQGENARAISEAAQELFTRVCRFTEHFERLRSSLERANQAFNEAVGSYDRMIRPSGERLAKLGAGIAGREFADLSSIPPTLRVLSLPQETSADPATPKHPEP